jgi:acetyl-CoA carboxylase biotin carboxyl carrier protein
MTEETQPMGPEPAEVVAPEVVAPEVVAPDAAPATDPAPGEPPEIVPVMAPRDGNDVELLGLIDRLATLLDRSDLTELEVEVGGTGLVLRKPAALAPPAATAQVVTTTIAGDGSVTSVVGGEPATAGREPPARPSVKAPLTGIFYASPAPGSAPYVAVGGEVAMGQVIGLIEAMKLFNEIKSDLAGRVVRVIPESGTLVKAKQPLIEVEPL